MDPANKPPRTAAIVAPGQGRAYPMGKMRAIFKADTDQTDTQYSISEWWLEPQTTGPGAYSHPEDHVYYVIEGEPEVVEGTACQLADGSWRVVG